MSILSMMEIQTCILAINDKGELLIWDLKDNKSTGGTYVFENDISILPSKLRFDIDKNGLCEINHVDKLIVMNNSQMIYIATLNQIAKSNRSSTIEGIIQISGPSFLDKKQHVNCILIIDQSHFLVGTNRANLILYNFNKKNVVKIVDLAKQNGGSQINQASFTTNLNRNSQITSLSHHFNEGLILVGSSKGKLYTFSLQLFDYVSQFQLKDKQTLTSINKIKTSKLLDRVYCLHDNYITQWSTKLNTCVSYIDYKNPRDLLQMNGSLYLIGNTSKLMRVHEAAFSETDLSMRSAKTVAKISQKLIAVGGSQGVIDVFINGLRLMTLFTN